jgi:hypothetical protein
MMPRRTLDEDVPWDLARLAWAEARACNHRHVGVEHYLLGLAKLIETDEPETAPILQAAGVSSERLREAVAERLPVYDKPPRKTYPTGWDDVHRSPATYKVEGRAAGLIIGLGVTRAKPLYFVLALIWEGRHFVDLFRETGIESARVLGAMREGGLPVPPGEPPDQVVEEWGERVEVEAKYLEMLLRRVPQALPPEATFSFNFSEEKAWLRATEGVDLSSLIDALVAESSASENANPAEP